MNDATTHAADPASTPTVEEIKAAMEHARIFQPPREMYLVAPPEYLKWPLIAPPPPRDDDFDAFRLRVMHDIVCSLSVPRAVYFGFDPGASRPEPIPVYEPRGAVAVLAIVAIVVVAFAFAIM